MVPRVVYYAILKLVAYIWDFKLTIFELQNFSIFKSFYIYYIRIVHNLLFEIWCPAALNF